MAQDEHFNTANSVSELYDLESYSDPDHNTPCDNFADFGTQHTVYIYCTNLIPNHDYRVSYYDGSDNKVVTDQEVSSDGSGNLSSQHTFRETEPTDQPGTWHVIVYEATYTAPPIYDSGWSDMLVVDTFNVQQSAIPEFPTALGAIAALALSACVYLWLRRKLAPVSS